jgi:hypothetical protein
MPAQRFLALVAGRIRQIAAVVVSAGTVNEGDIVALDAAGKIDPSVLPVGVGLNTVPATATEPLAAGDVVNLYNQAGSIAVRKADATAEGKECSGFVKATTANGAVATVYTPGNIMTGLSGLTPGARQYLHKVPGLRVETPPSSPGNVVQMLGIASSATSMVFEPEEPITIA